MPRKGLFVNTRRDSTTLTEEQLLLLELAPQYFEFDEEGTEDAQEVDELYEIQKPMVQLTASETMLCILQSIHMVLVVNDRMTWNPRLYSCGMRFKKRGYAMQLKFTDASRWKIHDVFNGNPLRTNAASILAHTMINFSAIADVRTILSPTLAELGKQTLSTPEVYDVLVALSESLFWYVRDRDVRDPSRRMTARCHELRGIINDTIEALNQWRGGDALDEIMQNMRL